ncbi:MAG: hypothetical protein JWQ38_613, partial [Flavipsychrobacter sp.]|nr:hypothetical protein [Flavipsychrobacter sp.]
MSFILLALGITNANAQKYVPFPTANATWTQRHGNGEADPSFYVVGLKTDDTVITGITYHKIYRSDHATLDGGTFIGGLREDGAKHIY